MAGPVVLYCAGVGSEEQTVGFESLKNHHILTDIWYYVVSK